MRARRRAAALALGAEFPPQMIMERDWLEAAQKAHRTEIAAVKAAAEKWPDQSAESSNQLEVANIQSTLLLEAAQ